MIRSMTGFARLKRPTPLGEATFSLKSVNHRALDLQLSLPPLLDPFEIDLRNALKRHASRGHVELRVSLERTGAGGAIVRRDLLDAYVSALRDAAAAYGLAAEPDLNAALRVPGMIQEAPPAEMTGAAVESLRAALIEGVEACCGVWNEFRLREGGELALDMLARVASIQESAAALGPLRQSAAEALRKRLEERISELELKVDPHRMAQEVAILIERSDIAEEISRLTIHATQLGQLLQRGGEIGKKLDFLLQETNRETNTVLSKSANAGEAGIRLGDLALGIKTEIEKIREQSLNVE